MPCFSEPDRLHSCSLVLHSLATQVALVEQLVDEVWQGPSAITLNAEWASLPVPAQYKTVRDSFQVVYSFLPVAIQVCVCVGACDSLC